MSGCHPRPGPALSTRPFPMTSPHLGVSHDDPSTRPFPSDALAFLCRLADALALDERSYDIRSNKGGPAVSCELPLHGQDVWVQLSLGLSGPDREVCFRKVQGRDDPLGDRNFWASIRELFDPGRFPARNRREIRLAPSHPVVPRLLA